MVGDGGGRWRLLATAVTWWWWFVVDDSGGLLLTMVVVRRQAVVDCLMMPNQASAFANTRFGCGKHRFVY